MTRRPVSLERRLRSCGLSRPVAIRLMQQARKDPTAAMPKLRALVARAVQVGKPVRS